jgi:hypothetical protein
LISSASNDQNGGGDAACKIKREKNLRVAARAVPVSRLVEIEIPPLLPVSA